MQALKPPLATVTIIPTTKARALAFPSNDLRRYPNTAIDSGNAKDTVHLDMEYDALSVRTSQDIKKYVPNEINRNFDNLSINSPQP